MNKISEFHLFAGIGGGIYAGNLLGHTCCGAVEIDSYCKEVLSQKQVDGWMSTFPIFDDIRELDGKKFRGQFDILSGGFPCQAFSHAARGKNIKEKNLWPEMLRFIIQSETPVVFAENVTLKAIKIAAIDLQQNGYTTKYCKLSNGDLGADHRRNRYWLLAHKDQKAIEKIAQHHTTIPPFEMNCWSMSMVDMGTTEYNTNKKAMLKAIGNAQSPIVAVTAFRVLLNRFINNQKKHINVSQNELDGIYVFQETWIKRCHGIDFGYVHTPTTMANYSAPSMMKHAGCRNFVEVFGQPTPANAEFLMGLPQGASYKGPMSKHNMEVWRNSILPTQK